MNALREERGRHGGALEWGEGELSDTGEDMLRAVECSIDKSSFNQTYCNAIVRASIFKCAPNLKCRRLAITSLTGLSLSPSIYLSVYLYIYLSIHFLSEDWTIDFQLLKLNTHGRVSDCARSMVLSYIEV